MRFNLKWNSDILLDEGLPEGIYLDHTLERDNQRYLALVETR
jgi:hypothetical protein